MCKCQHKIKHGTFSNSHAILGLQSTVDADSPTAKSTNLASRRLRDPWRLRAVKAYISLSLPPSSFRAIRSELWAVRNITVDIGYSVMLQYLNIVTTLGL